MHPEVRLRKYCRRSLGFLSGFRPLGRALVVKAHLGEDPLHPSGSPPVCGAEKFHQGRHEERAHHGGIQQNGEGQAQSQHLDARDTRGHKGQEVDGQNEGRRRDDAPTSLKSKGDGFFRAEALIMQLFDAAEQE